MINATGHHYERWIVHEGGVKALLFSHGGFGGITDYNNEVVKQAFIVFYLFLAM